MRIKTNEVIYRDDLYPRFEPSQSTIQKYSDSVDQLPPIKLNQNNILIDGFHRWKAHQLAGMDDISYVVIQTDSEKHLKQLAYQYNSIHGLQLKTEEKKRFAQEMFGQVSVDVMCEILSVSQRSIFKWTETQVKANKKNRERKIFEMYLRAWNTQQGIADLFDVDHATIKRIVEKNVQNCTDAKMHNFSPFIYNIWNTQKQDNERKHFGAFPEIFMQNLIHFHTDPMDIIFDPFGGGGTTIDVCKQMVRRYYVSDRKVIPGREKDIREHDIANGLPDDLQKPKLVFLDPPYWKQAEGKYSEDAEDLGNMALNEFNSSMENLFSEISKRKIDKIAVVIQPTQYSNDFKWQDHIFDFDKMLPGYKIVMRYILPYSTQQYQPQNVIKAKEENKCLGLNRDLVVWERL